MKHKILIIEDNEQNLYLLKFIVKKYGYEVSSARDGKEGLEMVGRIKPDLILLDIQLPIIDGYTVAKTLRTKQEFEATPIVAVTSYAMVGDREKAFECGFNGYIEKPIDPMKIMAEIEQFLPGNPHEKKNNRNTKR